MKEYIEKVSEFHKAFKIHNNSTFGTLLAKDYLLRHSLMKEENEEYLNACLEDNKIEIADALGDKLYVLLGTIIQHGFQDKIEEVFNEIHRSNMSKLDEDGNPLYDINGKVKKSELYSKPDLTKIIE